MSVESEVRKSRLILLPPPTVRQRTRRNITEIASDTIIEKERVSRDRAYEPRQPRMDRELRDVIEFVLVIGTFMIVMSVMVFELEPWMFEAGF